MTLITPVTPSCPRTWDGARMAASSSARRARVCTGYLPRRAVHCWVDVLPRLHGWSGSAWARPVGMAGHAHGDPPGGSHGGGGRLRLVGRAMRLVLHVEIDKIKG